MSRVISNTTPTARKEHRCDLCGRAIRAGEIYRRWRVAEVTPQSVKWCAHCDALVTEADLTTGYYDDEGIGPDTIRDADPRDWTEARWLVQWRRRWACRVGTLYPVPGGRGSELTQDHAFQPVAGHPDDDECTHRSDGTDGTYCGQPEAMHESGRWA